MTNQSTLFSILRPDWVSDRISPASCSAPRGSICFLFVFNSKDVSKSKLKKCLRV